MSTTPLPGPAPEPAGQSTSVHILNKCFVCGPAGEHERAWVPEDGPKERTLVLCFDGTKDSFDQDNSNVVQFLAMLRKDDPKKQLVYYQAGIGTYTSNVIQTPIIAGMSKLVDSMIAWNMPEHIKDGYHFLMQNYCVGDQICIFGFSRGAFTARALAGMLQKVGLLPPWNREQLPFAYEMYAKDDKEGRDLCREFKETFSTNVRIKFLGVWDTVQSTGLIPRYLPFSNSNHAILHFRHALSLDERRVKFIPSFCTVGRPKHEGDDDFSKNDKVVHENGHHNGPHGIERREDSEGYERGVNALTGSETDVKEVFFAGVHCDVGGGSVKNRTRHSLARIPLRWMIKECFDLDVGIIFDEHMLKNKVGLEYKPNHKASKALPSTTRRLTRPDSTELQGFSASDIPATVISALGSPFRRVWRSLPGPRNLPQAAIPCPSKPIFIFEGEAEEELADALSPVYDQLKKHTYWKIMEWIPWVVKKQRAEMENDIRAYKLIWNRGKSRIVYRKVMERGMKVHRSVRTRMLAVGNEGEKQYRPKIRCEIEGKIRRPKRDEWLAENPTFFEWVD